MIESSPSGIGIWVAGSPDGSQSVTNRKLSYNDNCGNIRNRVSPAFKIQTPSSQRTFSYDNQNSTPSNRQFRAYHTPSERTLPTISDEYTETNQRKRSSFVWTSLLMVILFCFILIGIVNIYETMKERDQRLSSSSSSAEAMNQNIQSLKHQLDQSKKKLNEVETNLSVLEGKLSEEKKKKEQSTQTDNNKNVDSLIAIEDLLSELQTLQLRVQEYSKSTVLKRFGQGPYHVQFDLQLPTSLFSEQDGNSIVLEMAPLDYQPESVFTFLTQVTDGVWVKNNASIYRNAFHLLQIHSDVSTTNDYMAFNELPHPYFKHDVFTVGYAGSGGSWFINLKPDNIQIHANLPCFAKVIEGFELIMKIHQSIPTNHDAEEHDYILEPIRITNAFVIGYDSFNTAQEN